eukprot:3129533-Pyramimonas_sp.AAC.1
MRQAALSWGCWERRRGGATSPAGGLSQGFGEIVLVPLLVRTVPRTISAPPPPPARPTASLPDYDDIERCRQKVPHVLIPTPAWGGDSGRPARGERRSHRHLLPKVAGHGAPPQGRVNPYGLGVTFLGRSVKPQARRQAYGLGVDPKCRLHICGVRCRSAGLAV